MTAPWGAGALHQRLNAFVKKSLIQQLVPPGAVVCDLYCGRGVDTENWGEAKIEKYVGVDLSSSALEEAKEEWEKNEKPFVARFCELNPCMADLEKHLGVERLSVDVVTCLSHMQDCFASEDMVRQLLKNVASLLKPGGFFFGATPDSSTIWYKYQKAVEGAMKAGSLRANGQLPRVRTELYSISFEDDRFNEYGSRYQLRFTDESVPPQSQILVHFPSLIRRAEELGLECVEIQNLTEFYEDYRGPFAETLQKICGTLVDAKGHPVVDGKSRLSPIAQDVLSLYTTFIFKKPDPLQREKALKRPAAPTPARTPAPADAKKSKKFSPAFHLLAPDDRPPKKQRSSDSPAVATSNGSKISESNSKQDKSFGSSIRPKLDKTTSKHEPARPSAKVGKPHVNVSDSKPQESKAPKSDVSSSEAPGHASAENTERPTVSKVKGLGGQKIDASPSNNKSNEGGRRSDNLGAQELGLQQPSRSKNADPDTDRPSSSGLLAESHRRSGNESGQAQIPLKRKRVSRWSSEYVPKRASSHSPERKDDRATVQHSDQGVADKKFGDTPARSQGEGDMVSRLASSGREAQVGSSAQQLRDGVTLASDCKPPHDGKHHRNSPLSRQETREEGEVPADDPASPTRDRGDVTGPHQAAQKVALSETVSGRSTESIASETPHLNERKPGPAIEKNPTASSGEASASEPQPQPQPQPRQSSTPTRLELGGKPTMDEGKPKGEQLTNHHHQQKGTGASQSVNPRPRKKEIAMDVLLDRASTENAATCDRPSDHPPVVMKKRDPDLASGGPDQKKQELAAGDSNDFKLSISDISPQTERKDSNLELSSELSRRDSSGSRREMELAWETKPQRYTLRRAASQVIESELECPPVWSRSGTREQQQQLLLQNHHARGAPFLPRVSYVVPVGGAGPFSPGLRAPIRPEERRIPLVVPPLTLGAGLLGAAPSPILADRRFDIMAGHPPELRPVPRPSLRGSLYKSDRAIPGAPRSGGGSEFVAEGAHISSVRSNGLGTPWDDHFPGDPRSRINR